MVPHRCRQGRQRPAPLLPSKQIVLNHDNGGRCASVGALLGGGRGARTSRARRGVELAGRRARSATVLARLRPVRRRSAPRHRHCGGPWRCGARADGRHGELRRVGAGRRPCAHDPDRERLLRHAVAAWFHVGGPRCGRRGRLSGRHRRRERRRGHSRGARAPWSPANGRRGGIRRPARVPAAADERSDAAALRPRSGAVTRAVTQTRAAVGFAGSGCGTSACACADARREPGARSDARGLPDGGSLRGTCTRPVGAADARCGARCSPAAGSVGVRAGSDSGFRSHRSSARCAVA
jgi:hypothetical protein